MAFEYDAYLIHASENENLARDIASGLGDYGFRIWFNDFVPGFSIRRQMEAGLQSASVAILLVTAELFSKKWALEEVDAALSLEGTDQGRLVPVWAGVTADEVKRFSSMLASRHAIIHESAERTVGRLADTMTGQLPAISPAQLLRSRIKGGLGWVTGPSWFSSSLRYYDEHFDEFQVASLARFPDPLPHMASENTGVTSLGDLIAAPSPLDGSPFVVIGHQRNEGRQTLEVEQGLIQVGRDEGIRLASYVFQLHSLDLPDCIFAYVHCYGPWSPSTASRTWGPWGSNVDLCWVKGVVIAEGAVPMSDGRIGQCVYIAASAIYFCPPASQGSPVSH